MLKFNFLAIVAFLSFSGTVFSQKTEDQTEAEKKGKNQGDLVLKVRNPHINTSDTLTITGIGPMSFIVSNTSDGTSDTYRQSQKIVLPLLSPKSNKYQLVFYGQYDNIAYAVAKEEEKTTIYYPVYMFEEIKQKLEQSLSQRKKVELRVTIKKDGFREGILMF